MGLAEIAQRLIPTLNPWARKIHLAVLYVEYDRQKGPDSDRVFAALQGYLAAIANCRITYIRVDNRYEEMPLARLADDVYATGGDNGFREFSGWQWGMAALATLACPYDLVLITNEMFLKPGPSFLQDYATEELLKRSLRDHTIIGRIDTSFQDFTLFGYDVSSWVCTNCVFIPKAAVAALGDFALINDNIHALLPRRYDPGHLLLARRPLAHDAASGEFCLELELDTAPGAGNEIRIRFGLDPAAPLSLPDGEGVRVARLGEVMVNGQPLPQSAFIRGVVTDDRGELHATPSLLLALPGMATSPSHLTIRGRLAPELCDKNFNALPTIVVYNDAKLFLPDAPINRTYQRGVVEWLTERWHSRFEINHETWELFTTKAAAIFNEALLTAKFRELGYPAESYGDKKYY